MTPDSSLNQVKPARKVLKVPLPWKDEKCGRNNSGSSPGHKNRPVISFSGVTKIYTLESGNVTGIENLSVEIFPGEFIAIMGPSGSGKSTLLNLMGCLDTANTGEIWITGKNIGLMSDNQLTSLRLNTIGFIFQYFNLFPLFSALGNVHYPYVIKTGKSRDTSRAEAALGSVGLKESLWHHKPSQLSGGQQQRVAIARALVNDPTILLCDEPTGNLDTRTGTSIIELLSGLSTNEGRTVVMVTHDPKTAEYADRIVRIVDGRIAEGGE
jgi:putative ABC transport system ATP-binding protein